MSLPSERGVALVTVLLVVAIAAALAGEALWRQRVWTQQTENLRHAAQAQAIALAAMDWVGLILAEDRSAVDHLDEPWAQPVALPVEYGQARGRLTDLQGRFNLNNLVRQGQASAEDVAIFRRLLQLLELSPTLADALIDWLDADAVETGLHGAEDGWYLAQDPPRHAANDLLADVGELVQVRGFDAETVARLAPHVCALPTPTAVNVNTASAEVLAAHLPGLDPMSARRLVSERGVIETLEALRARLAPAQWQHAHVSRLAVASQHFLLDIELRFDRHRQAWQALYHRAGERRPRLLWTRPVE